MPTTSSWMTADIVDFRDTVRRFIAEEITPHQTAWNKQQHVDRAVWNKAGAIGMLLADIPEEYGGSGGTFAHQCAVLEELGLAGDSNLGVAVQIVVAHYLLNQGTEAQRAKYLPLIARGEMVTAIAMTEPSAGSDLQGIRTKAELDGDFYRLNGSKTFISNGYLADLILVVCKTDATKGAKGISMLLVETKECKGFRVGRILEKLGQKGQDTCELFFDDARVPKENILGGIPGQGFFQLMTELPYERLIIAVTGVACIERALALTVAHCKERQVFGKALIEMQNTRFVLAEIKTQATVARAFIDRCIVDMMEGRMNTELASMAKYWVTDLQCEAIDKCLQLFGGYGYMMEYPITQMYADARIQKIYGGANEIMKEVIARGL